MEEDEKRINPIRIRDASTEWNFMTRWWGFRDWVGMESDSRNVQKVRSEQNLFPPNDWLEERRFFGMNMCMCMTVCVRKIVCVNQLIKKLTVVACHSEAQQVEVDERWFSNQIEKWNWEEKELIICSNSWEPGNTKGEMRGKQTSIVLTTSWLFHLNVNNLCVCVGFVLFCVCGVRMPHMCALLPKNEGKIDDYSIVNLSRCVELMCRSSVSSLANFLWQWVQRIGFNCRWMERRCRFKSPEWYRGLGLRLRREEPEG